MAQGQDATAVPMLLHGTSLACSSWDQAGVFTVVLCGDLVWKCPNTGADVASFGWEVGCALVDSAHP